MKLKHHFLQDGTQDGTRFRVKIFGINFPHRRLFFNKYGWEERTFAAFTLTATGSSTRPIPLASFRSSGFTK
jgi:hypothetical protein